MVGILAVPGDLGNLLGTHLKNLVAGILAVPGSLGSRGGEN